MTGPGSIVWLRPDLLDFPDPETALAEPNGLALRFLEGIQLFNYLIDPAGNLMMTYPAVNDPASILSDMRRLLKVSQIG